MNRAVSATASSAVVAALVFAILILCSVPGCTVPPKAARQIRLETAAADGTVRLWPTFPPAERLVQFQDARLGLWFIRYVLLDELPEDLALRAMVLALAEAE